MVQPRLPPELISEIFKKIPGRDEPLMPYASLAACCLVSRSFLPLARAELWSKITWTTGGSLPREATFVIADDNLDSFLDIPGKKQLEALRGDPQRFGTLVQEVYIATRAHEFRMAEAFADFTRRACPNVARLDAVAFRQGSTATEAAIARFRGRLSRFSYFVSASWDLSRMEMLCSLTGLHYLSLIRAAIDVWNSTEAPADVLPCPSFHLHTLIVRCDCSRVVFDLITRSSTYSLTRVHLPALGHDRQAWDFSPFPALTSLLLHVAGNTLGDWQLDTYSLVMDAIASTRSLRSLALGERTYSTRAIRLQVKDDFLGRLPPTIQSLRLHAVDLAENQLLKALEDPTVLPALRHIAVRDLVPIVEEGPRTPVMKYREISAEEKIAVERQCERRSATIDWVRPPMGWTAHQA